MPADHPLADPNSPAGNSGLHNLRLGPIRLPVAPTFVIRIMRPMPNVTLLSAANLNYEMNPTVRIGTNDPTPEELLVIDNHIERISATINRMIMRF